MRATAATSALPNEADIGDVSPEKDRVGGSISSLATILLNKLQGRQLTITFQDVSTARRSRSTPIPELSEISAGFRHGPPRLAFTPQPGTTFLVNSQSSRPIYKRCRPCLRLVSSECRHCCFDEQNSPSPISSTEATNMPRNSTSVRFNFRPFTRGPIRMRLKIARVSRASCFVISAVRTARSSRIP
jgi:hypothetical protein